MKSERGLFELYSQDPERADAITFNRRGVLKGAGLSAMAMAVGSAIPFARHMPIGMIPAALAQEADNFVIPGKDGLVVLNDRPVNAETPPHLLDNDVTPNARHFVRNNGIIPDQLLAGNADGWTLTVDGEVRRPLTLSLAELTRKFDVVTLQLQLECGGNGRAGFNPPARGNQWSTGAVGCAAWTGVRFADVLKAAGLKDSAVYTGHYGADLHLSGDPDKAPLSRGAPIAKMMDPSTLIAFEMNGEPIPVMNGFPLRVVAPGWPGSVSQKWLKRIWVRDRLHDGAKMIGTSYRVPAYPVAPGAKVPKQDFIIIQSMPVKSLITHPATGLVLKAGTRTLDVRGHAWAGDDKVAAVHVTTDFGATWIKADLSAPANRHAWQRWRAQVNFPTHGYYEVWARATDDQGRTQPFAVAWNPKGYLNNSLHRISVTVTA